MPKPLRPIFLAPILAAVLAVTGCGGSSGPDPSISAGDAQTLLGKIAEIKANVDVGSCVVAGDKTDDLLADIADLPSSVNNDVKESLDNGANNLKILLNDPSKCEGRSETTTAETTTTPDTTTEPTTTRQRTEPTTTTPTQTQTTPTQTQTTPTQPQTTPGASGGIGPGGL
ncbi:MAG TPA: hypothetical protein VI035_02485 [Solirubrobacterales bacterium]